ncbi:leucine-rich repeat flightless-interacting protein 1 isoform X15 [Trichosurus vulpecula]|uniref:leucine-rich repeat flightless-interacting protein 1 isoform X15 n=1 Tax=Trichosurus vulpecula TaxID=9337 RepID=UPI00186AE526|nr:leucine-rich repeat flightless-interacting protein 1 isoform X15 [Trichosurus vulpecula]
MEMGTQGSGRRRLPQRERLTAEDDALSQIAREAEARLAAKRAARAEAREIRMKELERQQKEIYQVQKKYYGLETKWGDIEQWMEESERYSHRFRRNPSASDEDERMSVGSRGSLRTNGHDADLYGSSSLNRKSSRSSRSSKESKVPSRLSSREEKLGSYYSDLGLSYTSLPSRPLSASQNGARSSFLYRDVKAAWRYRASLYDESIYSGSRRYSASNSHPPSEYSGYLGSGSRASSRASSAHGSPVVEERPEKDFAEKGSRNMPSLSAATLASLGGTSSRRGSGDTSISVDTEASMREIKEINELKDQIQDVEGKYMQGLKEMKDSLAEVEEKYRKAMVSNAQLDNEKTNFMYQVDTLKDALLELEEQLAESRRQYEEKNKEFEREKHAHSVLQFQFAEAKEALKQREEMLAEIRQLQQKQESYIREISDLQETIEWRDKKIGALERQKEYFDSIRSERDDLRAEAILLKEELKKHGIILNSEITTNGEPLDNLSNVSHLGSPKMSQQETNALKSSGDGTLGRASEVEVASENVDKVGESPVLQPQADSAEADIRLKNLVDERECLLEQIKKLKGQLEERQKNGQLETLRSEDDILENGTDIHVLDLQRDANRQISDLRFKLAKSEQEITALEQNVIRLEGQVSRYKSAAENAERVEDELKAEKRKLQRELRSALDKTEELEVSNGHLVRRLEKMKANRSALLSQQ